MQQTIAGVSTKQKLTQGLTHLLFGIPAFLVLSSILAPVLEVSGWQAGADRLYSLLSYICPQIPSHSLWLFGAPTGVSSRSLFLYLAFVGGGLFMLRRYWFLAWWQSLLLLVPIFIDGLSQLVGWRESTNLLRVLTGTLGGVGIAGLVMPVWFRALLASSDGIENLSSLSILNRATAGLTIMVVLGATFPYGVAMAQAKLAIPGGTGVVVKTQKTVTSATATRGQAVHFDVSQDVQVKGKVVIQAGTPAIGEVLSVVSPKMLGKEGELRVAIRYTTAVDGTQVPLRASLTEKGIGVCPLFLVMKGKEAEIRAGTEFSVSVDRPVEVTVP